MNSSKMRYFEYSRGDLEDGIKSFLQQLENDGEPDFTAMSVAEAREMFKGMANALEAPAEEMKSTEDFNIPGPAGALGVRHYHPETVDINGPALVFYHGGGWVIGDLDTHDALCRRLAHHGGMHVFAVDYRLAPEHIFPAAIDDACATFLWIRDHAVQLGIDSTRLAVGGDSAGGNISAATANLLTKSGDPPAHQFLIYPAVQFAGLTVSRVRLSQGYFLKQADMDFFEAAYLPNKESALDPKASPLAEKDLTKAPPATIVTAGFDPLCDEGVAYADRLEMAGVPVTNMHWPDMIHGFFSFTALSPKALQAVQESAKLVGAALKG